MAEYYPLLAKAVGSLPNSTPESRRVVYERARKALIGQLRTLHPPVPDDDIESESVALDRAIERLESELATGGIPASAGQSLAPTSPESATPPARPTPAPSTPAPSTPAAPTPAANVPQPGRPAPAKLGIKPSTGLKSSSLKTSASDKPAADPRTPPPLKTKVPKALVAKGPADGTLADALAEAPRQNTLPHETTPAPQNGATPPIGTASRDATSADVPPSQLPAILEAEAVKDLVEPLGPTRLKPPRADQKTDSPKSDAQRPIAPQPPVAKGPKRRLWVIPVVVVAVMAAVGFAAWKLRDHPETIAKGKPTEPSQADSGKIAERVGGPATAPATDETPPPSQAASPSEPSTANNAPTPQPAPAPSNPDLPVAHRAALLVEAPDEPNKVKTFLGTVVWKLNNVPQGPNDSVGLAVEADIDLPDDKMKAVITFAKNTEASLPASHTINVRYSVEPGSFTGDVKQISVPQMRPEASPSGEPLAGVTVQIVPNSFLVGLSPGNAETANTDLIRRLQWIDIPMMLDSGKIAKLTFEKSDSGQRDLTEALDAWAKQ